MQIEAAPIILNLTLPQQSKFFSMKREKANFKRIITWYNLFFVRKSGNILVYIHYLRKHMKLPLLPRIRFELFLVKNLQGTLDFLAGSEGVEVFKIKYSSHSRYL